MKRIILSFLSFFFIAAFSYGQTLANVDTGKYSIHLPSYWKPGNKIWEILTDKLPIVCEELKDKDLCGDRCNPKYSIEFEMSEPDIFDYYSNHVSSGSTTQTWEFVTLYRFSAMLLLLNEEGHVLTRLILVDTNEVWRVIHQASLPSATTTVPMKIYVQSAGFSQLPYYRSATPGQSPFAYINNNKDKLSPTQRDMFNVVDEKIRAW